MQSVCRKNFSDDYSKCLLLSMIKQVWWLHSFNSDTASGLPLSGVPLVYGKCIGTQEGRFFFSRNSYFSVRIIIHFVEYLSKFYSTYVIDTFNKDEFII